MQESIDLKAAFPHLAADPEWVTFTPIEPGDVPTYLAFAAATIAATIAWLAWRRQVKNFKIQEDSLKTQINLLRDQISQQQESFSKQLESMAEQVAFMREESLYRQRLEERGQAVLISTWPGEDAANLLNRSGQPVHSVVVTSVAVQGAAWNKGEELPEHFHHSHRRELSLLPDGEWHVPIGLVKGGMQLRPGTEIAFTDFQGAHWIRRANGQLERIHTNPIEYYNLMRPADICLPSYGLASRRTGALPD
ncbi:hypothetical protein ACFWNN_01960 [Lentzea sp. NPDC058450]|uniref:hypothetical protein n=1 Tax=Lentzea sp. NPDC058450 TaxID=3346505 RepID=UPI003654BE4B